MNYNKIIICMFLIIIPLILLVLYYRNYVYYYCKNDMKCAKEKLILNLDNLITSLKIKYFDITNKIQKKEDKKEDKKGDKIGDKIGDKKEDKIGDKIGDKIIQEESMQYRKEIINEEGVIDEENINIYNNVKNKNYSNIKNRNYNNIVYENNNEKYENNVVEGFFGGFDSWFPSSTPSKAPVLPGTLPDENLNLLEKKINDKLIPSNKFPPEELHGNSDDFKDSSNDDILDQSKTKDVNDHIKDKYNHNINKNPTEEIKKIQEIKNFQHIKNPILNKQNMTNMNIKNNSAPTPAPAPAPVPAPAPAPVPPQQDIKNLFNSCQFFNDKCPDDYFALGNFSIQGTESNNILSCGNVQNTKPAHAIAQIKNNSIYEIHITDPGHGFNPASSPKVSIEGGKGHGATAEAVIDDDGFLKLIKVINPGYNYTETPKVLIQAPFMNSSCHLCCKNNPI